MKCMDTTARSMASEFQNKKTCQASKLVSLQTEKRTPLALFLKEKVRDSRLVKGCTSTRLLCGVRRGRTGHRGHSRFVPLGAALHDCGLAAIPAEAAAHGGHPHLDDAATAVDGSALPPLLHALSLRRREIRSDGIRSLIQQQFGLCERRAPATQRDTCLLLPYAHALGLAL